MQGEFLPGDGLVFDGDRWRNVFPMSEGAAIAGGWGGPA